MFRFALILVLAAGLSGCATTNDSGVILHRKPDLSGVSPGTPVEKIKGLGVPLKKEAFLGDHSRSAEVWFYEWDLPDDGVNNRMFTSVVVQDGLVLGYSEETADKWRQDASLHRMAKVDSALEDVASLNALAARHQRVASIRGNYNLAPYAEAWDRIAERTRFIRGSAAGLAGAGTPGAAPPVDADIAEVQAAGLAPVASGMTPGDSPAPPVLSAPKTLRELEIEELRIRRDPTLTKKERLRRLHEVWKQQREVTGEG